MYSIAVLISGSGSNLQALIDAQQEYGYSIDIVISNIESAYGLVRAKNAGIKTHVTQDENEMLELLANVELVVLAGYLKILSADFLERLSVEVINIHPSLLPKHGGLFGHHVHESVLSAGEKVSGATVHEVIPEVDAGRIILQESISIEGLTSAEQVAAEVLKVEHRILKQAVKNYFENGGCA